MWKPASVAKRLAMAQRMVASAAPASIAAAALNTISRAASISVAMSASLNWSAWNSAILRPNCSRVSMCSRAASKQARAPPSEQAPMLTRPPSSALSAILKPSPSAPSRLATGTRQSSTISIAVGWLCQPSLRSGAPKLRPGVPSSMTRHEMPAAPSPPVRTMQR